MSDNVAIKEGARAYNFTTDKIRTAQQNSDEPVIWVPESTVQLGSLRASDNGVYLAQKEGLYGFNEIVVSVNGTATIGDRAVFPDDDGELHEANLPHSIVVVTPPRKLKYEDRQRIDFSGIIVKAVDAGGNTWTNAKYPNGHIPLGELFFDHYYADIEKVEADIYTTPAGIRAEAYTKEEFKYKEYAGSPTWRDRVQYVCPRDMGGGWYLGSHGGGGTVYITKWNGKIYAVCAEGANGGLDKYVDNTDFSYTTALYSLAGGTSSWAGYPNFSNVSGGSGALWGKSDFPESTVNPITQTMDGATPEEGQQTITVYWHRYGDGQILSATFGITVTPNDGFSGGSGNF